jgi:potassium large conductance calcium-activated channel subfamily M alpha protein 1
MCFFLVIYAHPCDALGYSTPTTLNNRDRCRIGQVPIFDGPMAKFGEGGIYADLFVAALRNFGVLCIGLYRYVHFEQYVWS